MKLVKAIYRKFRKFFSKHGYFAFGSLAISVYYFHKIFQKKIPQVKLSYFLIGLSNNLITEIYRIGSNIKFRGPTDDWYQTDASILKDNALKDLLRENSKIIYNNGLNIFFNFNRQNLLIYICSGLLIFQTFKLFGNNPEIRQNLQTNNKEITFKDVCGMNEAKNELLNCVEFMKNPKRFHNIGARLKKGILIYGKPGTGKTFLAKALSGETNFKFINCVGSEFTEIYQGHGALKIRKLFEKARKNQPCIILIDEIDGLGVRSKFNNDDRNNTINQLLSEMDGFKNSQMVLVVGITNKIELVDETLLRAGRFDLKIKIEIPDTIESIEIMKKFLENKNNKISEEKIIEIVSRFKQVTGADIQKIINECSYLAYEKEKHFIEDEDLEKSFKNFIIEKNNLLIQNISL